MQGVSREKEMQVCVWNLAAVSQKKREKTNKKKTQQHVVLNERGDIYIESPVLNQVDGYVEMEYKQENWINHAFQISKLEIVIEYLLGLLCYPRNVGAWRDACLPESILNSL